MTPHWKKGFSSLLTWLLVLMIGLPSGVIAQETESETAKSFRQEELDQMLAPIALYPDSLLAQVLMASTYPLEVVQADRWAQQNKALEGDALAEELEKQDWDPSVKSLVQFPDVLAMMGEQLDWTQKLGDAFLAQQEDVTNTVQNLRMKAKEADNLKTTEEQIVKVEKEVIIIEPAKTEVVYVPVYNPTVVYGSWWWPHYPPYYYYPPYYPRPTLYGFASGVAIGVAWGYAWGHWNWHRHSVNININRNINYNKNINRDRYRQQYGDKEGQWKHNPEHRKGVSYRDQKTAQQYNRAGSRDAVKSRENFRGKAEADRRDLARDTTQTRDRRPSPETKDRVQSRDKSTRPGPDTRDMSRSRDTVSRQAPETRERPQSRDSNRGAGVSRTQRGDAFSGMNQGSASRNYSQRGNMSRSGGASRGGGGRGGRR
ncbi:MAG: DUF3300 domain-containing protein [Deltaproteobacteria bacterium]|nr:DUF3300 domain-containing protein [Deltaproteobacteria bacterium]